MRQFRGFALAVMAGFFLMAVPKSNAAQISVQIGGPPVCPYGYYDFAPYNCAPYGYYGADWFSGGVFIGAGPWFHGPRGFHGRVNNRFDPHHGYHGGFPARGSRPGPGRPVGGGHFRGNEVRDGRGHVGGGGGHGR
jgi:hypothetical protein